MLPLDEYLRILLDFFVDFFYSQKCGILWGFTGIGLEVKSFDIVFYVLNYCEIH